MLERQREGIAKAKAQGRYKGRKPTVRAKSEEIKASAAQKSSMNASVAKLGNGKNFVRRARTTEK